MHLIEQVFGQGCDLYEVLGKCPRDADKAKLRKSYYRAALNFHPDRHPNDPEKSKQFQAISLAYQILQNPELRAEYDDTGNIPSDEVVDEATEDNSTNKAGVDQWKHYFDQIFGKVTSSDIDKFSSKYKCSDEERRDVLKEFTRAKGNLVKMLDYVMLSEPRDTIRWVEDFLRPALESGELDQKFNAAMEKTLKQCQKKVEKENKEMEDVQEVEAEEMEVDDEEGEEGDSDMDDDHKQVDDDEATESEESATNTPPAKTKENQKQPSKRATTKTTSKSKGGGTTKKTPPVQKGKPTKAKNTTKGKKQQPDMTSLVAAIQNKNKKGGANILADLSARYGVPNSDDDEDPLNDAQFQKIQSKLNNNKKKSSRKRKN